MQVYEKSLASFQITEENQQYYKNGVKLPKNILLHSCCAPCAIFPIADLRLHGIEPYLYFFNPNIHPLAELMRRADGVKNYAEKYALEYEIDLSYDEEKWLKFSSQKKSQHCQLCYGLRMFEAAKACKRLGYEGFTTTLLVSPYQNHDQIHRIAEQAAAKVGVKYYPFDWRFGFQEGQQKAKEEGIYRQRYCGCIYSISESFYAKKIAKGHQLDLATLPTRIQE